VRPTTWLLFASFVLGCGGSVSASDGSVPGDGALPDGSIGVDAGPTDCPLPLSCDATPPTPGAIVDWRHNNPWQTPLVTAQGDDRHRGRDLLLRVGEPQWALAKFAYGPADDDLKDEDVDMWLLRDCGSTWEFLGTATTTNDGDHVTVEGVEDSGGWVYFQIPPSAELGVGRHRIHFVVEGDHTEADQIIDVIDSDIPLVVSDVDGTLTESETAQFTTLLTGTPPAAQPYAADLLWELAGKGYTIFYVTARPEWLATVTHEWLNMQGFPPGLVHTTLTFTGATNTAAETFKTAELADISARIGHPPSYAFGNTLSDAGAYSNASIDPGSRYLYQYTGDLLGGTYLASYADLLGPVSALAPMCP
jgi:hypothetical protein